VVGACGVQSENSDVLPSGAIAVAVMTLPAGTLTSSVTVNDASPPASVVTSSFAPTNCWPSRLLEGSHREEAVGEPEQLVTQHS
jgi:hypothetical protein